MIIGGIVRRRQLRHVRPRLRAALPVDVAERAHLGDGRRAGGERARDGAARRHRAQGRRLDAPRRRPRSSADPRAVRARRAIRSTRPRGCGTTASSTRRKTREVLGARLLGRAERADRGDPLRRLQDVGSSGCSRRFGPDRQPRRDRLPGHAHGAPPGHPPRRGLFRRRSRRAARARSPTRPVGIGPAPAARELSRRRAHHRRSRARAGAEAIHPGYGFLSENPAFAEACEAAGIVFVGPPAAAIRAMGLKDAAKRLMEQAGVPVVPGYHGEDQDAAHPRRARRRRSASRADQGARRRRRQGHARGASRRGSSPPRSTSAGARPQARFGDDRVLIEKYLERPRHIEVQVFADRHGNVVHLFERDCSLQRRHQKVIEEAPAPGMPRAMRARDGRGRGQRGAGDRLRRRRHVEFIADVSDGLDPSASTSWR